MRSLFSLLVLAFLFLPACSKKSSTAGGTGTDTTTGTTGADMRAGCEKAIDNIHALVGDAEPESPRDMDVNNCMSMNPTQSWLDCAGAATTADELNACPE